MKKIEEYRSKEEKRLKALYEYEMDFFSNDDELDSITRLVSIICKTPLAFVNILDSKKVYIKSRSGTAFENVYERDITFCNLAIEQDDVFEVCNSLKDERFINNPFTLSNPAVIFYVAVPLKTPSGYNIGILCAIDHKENKLNQDQKTAMKTLAKHVIMNFDLKKCNKQLKISNDRAKELSVAKDNFLSNMSHEIRTPLNAIYGFTEILNKTKLNKTQQEIHDIVKSSVELLMAIINDILDFSKIESGKLIIEKYPFSLEEALKNIKDLFSQKAFEKLLELEFKISEKLPKVINGDKIRLNQILINLIGNAIKFTDIGKIQISTELYEEKEDKIGIIFSVKDTGIGIPEEKKDSIFYRFEQASYDISRKYGGTGLGLNISKSLIEMYGGKLNFESEVGKGSNFYFLIYFDKLSEDETKRFLNTNKNQIKNKTRININEKNQFNEKINEITNREKLDVLVCEDTFLNSKLLEKIFEDTIFDLDFAENGKIGLEKIKRKSYDMILLDLQMPIMNGFQFAEIIRKEKKMKTIIIAMTANNSELEKIKCLELGMDSYFSKPFKQNNLFLTIVDIFNRKFNEDYNFNDCNKKISNFSLPKSNYSFSLISNQNEEFKSNVENLNPNIFGLDKISLYSEINNNSISNLNKSCSLEKIYKINLKSNYHKKKIAEKSFINKNKKLNLKNINYNVGVFNLKKFCNKGRIVTLNRNRSNRSKLRSLSDKKDNSLNKNLDIKNEITINDNNTQINNENFKEKENQTNSFNKEFISEYSLSIDEKKCNSDNLNYFNKSFDYGFDYTDSDFEIPILHSELAENKSINEEPKQTSLIETKKSK